MSSKCIDLSPTFKTSLELGTPVKVTKYNSAYRDIKLLEKNCLVSSYSPKHLVLTYIEQCGSTKDIYVYPNQVLEGLINIELLVPEFVEREDDK